MHDSCYSSTRFLTRLCIKNGVIRRRHTNAHHSFAIKYNSAHLRLYLLLDITISSACTWFVLGLHKQGDQKQRGFSCFAAGGRSLGDVKSPCKQIVPRLTAEANHVAWHVDEVLPPVACPLDRHLTREPAGGLGDGRILHVQHHLPADPPGKRLHRQHAAAGQYHGVQPGTLRLTHHLLVSGIGEAHPVLGVGHHRRELVGLDLFLHLLRPLGNRDGWYGISVRAYGPDADTRPHRSHGLGHDHPWLLQLLQQVLLHRDRSVRLGLGRAR
ncbi:hypothetical protein MUK42_09235 [Musa troglodytarum]|uniref:Uncharacterized protein n=1 Tax=Musa troglodytarum TaxID=320322 RepID=A0A9E7ED57_9LILI|nr:hypothetical protein MUK42_09235 [Musa troglodytarum]